MEQQVVDLCERFGFRDKGIANSTRGGEEWHEMSYAIRKTDDFRRKL